MWQRPHTVYIKRISSEWLPVGQNVIHDSVGYTFRSHTRPGVLLCFHVFIRSSELHLPRSSVIDFRNRVRTIPATCEAVQGRSSGIIISSDVTMYSRTKSASNNPGVDLLPLVLSGVILLR